MMDTFGHQEAQAAIDAQIRPLVRERWLPGWKTVAGVAIRGAYIALTEWAKRPKRVGVSTHFPTPLLYTPEGDGWSLGARGDGKLYLPTRDILGYVHPSGEGYGGGKGAGQRQAKSDEPQPGEPGRPARTEAQGSVQRGQGGPGVALGTRGARRSGLPDGRGGSIVRDEAPDGEIQQTQEDRLEGWLQ